MQRQHPSHSDQKPTASFLSWTSPQGLSHREPEQHTPPGKQAEAEAVLTHRRVLLNPEPEEPTRPAHSLTHPEETSRPVSMAYPVPSCSAREISLFMVAIKRVLGSCAQAVPALQLPVT